MTAMLMRDSFKLKIKKKPIEEDIAMAKDVTRQERRGERLPVGRRSSVFAPWFDDVLEPARWLDEFFPREMASLYSQGRFLAPAIDIDETSDAYVVSADLPGIKKDDISIECAGNQLSISAERKYEAQEGRRNERRERYYGSFQRTFTLPSGADLEKIEADYDGGVLTVRIPKGESAKARRIEVSGKKGEQEQSRH